LDSQLAKVDWQELLGVTTIIVCQLGALQNWSRIIDAAKV